MNVFEMLEENYSKIEILKRVTNVVTALEEIKIIKELTAASYDIFSDNKYSVYHAPFEKDDNITEEKECKGFPKTMEEYNFWISKRKFIDRRKRKLGAKYIPQTKLEASLISAKFQIKQIPLNIGGKTKRGFRNVG